MKSNAGTERPLRSVIGLMAAWHLTSAFASSSDYGTLAVGDAISYCDTGDIVLSGFDSGLFGSYTPAQLTGGRTVISLVDSTPVICSNSSSFSALTVSGFSSSPGSSWLVSITCNGITNTGGSGVFSYGSGEASWTWTRQFGLLSKHGSDISCTIVHN